MQYGEFDYLDSRLPQTVSMQLCDGEARCETRRVLYVTQREGDSTTAPRGSRVCVLRAFPSASTGWVVSRAYARGPIGGGTRGYT
eukprot:2064392-Pyramimonas_sp.AAC.1